MSGKEPATATATASKASEPSGSEADIAQAFKDLARGERTAQLLEQQLSTVEKKIDDLLASVEEDEKAPSNAHSSSGASKDGATAEQMMNGTVQIKEDRAPIASEESKDDALPIMGLDEKSK